MKTSNRTNSEYPYQAHAPPPAASTANPAQRPSSLWRLLVRAVMACAVLSLIVALAIGLVAYQGWSQATVIARLEKLDCDVTYRHEFVAPKKNFRAWLRRYFGDRAWGEVTRLHIRYPSNATGADIRFISGAGRRLKSLLDLSVYGDEFSFDAISDWPHLNNLRWLRISSNDLHDDNLAKIASMPKLRYLEVSSSKVTIAGVQKLADSVSLETLRVGELRSSGPASSVSGFSRLNSLSVDARGAGDEALIALGPLPELRSADFEFASVGDGAARHLADCPKLESLSLAQTRITDEGLRALAGCPSLTRLDLSRTAVTDQGLAALVGTSIVDLTLDETQVTDAGLRHIGQLSSLQRVSLQQTQVTGVGLAEVSFAAPPAVDLSDAAITRDGLTTLAKAKLDDLDLSRTPLDDDGLMLFVANETLTRMQAFQTSITENGLRAFYEARKKRLKAEGREETLYVYAEYMDVPQQYLPLEMGMAPFEVIPVAPVEPPGAEEPASPGTAAPP
jgi:internalin A